mmetsp:Transcript_19457/g.34519  ORF Transcript_19457/g.34519 Transcript_19457/m.34519 type:complete len:100 (-) Transcript_19457:1060-1359(-)
MCVLLSPLCSPSVWVNPALHHHGGARQWKGVVPHKLDWPGKATLCKMVLPLHMDHDGRQLSHAHIPVQRHCPDPTSSDNLNGQNGGKELNPIQPLHRPQ